MAVNLSPLAGAGWQFLDNNGNVLSGGKLFTYAAGTTTNQVTYTSSSGNTAHTNPIILDAAGRVPGGSEVWLTEGQLYKLVLKTSTDVQLWTADNLSGINDVNAQDIPYLPPFTNSVETTVENKLAQFVTLEDFGAIGDGVADDTQALIDACAFIESSPDVNVLYIIKIYSINWLIIPNNYIEFTRDDVTICGGGTLLTRPAAYSAGVANGTFKYYTAFLFKGSRCTVQDITFDGNNQFSQYASSPSQPNYWFNAVAIEGLVGNRTENCKVINCRYINGGGWPFRGQYHNYGLIDGCYVEHSQGCGFDAGSLCVVSNNISYNAHDAHFATWNSLGGVISGNTCDTNDNGSGIDVSGSTDATVIGNTIRNNANRGIWVLQDPNTGNQCKNVVISGNTLTVNNTYVPISERGDIQVGPADVTTDARPPGTVDCRGLVITGNNIFSRANANAITLGKYAFYTNITGNVFSDDAGSAANRSIVLYNATNVVVRDNYDLIAIRKGASGQPKILGAGPVWFDDANTSLDTSVAPPSALGDVQTNYFVQTNRRNAPGKTYQIVKQYAYTEFGAEFNSANGDVDVANIAFTAGGFEVADIELIVTVGGNRGVRRTRVVYQGYAAVTPTQIVAAADEYSGGSAPPTVTFTASTGNVKISIGSNAVLTASFWMRVSGTSGTVPNVTALI